MKGERTRKKKKTESKKKKGELKRERISLRIGKTVASNAGVDKIINGQWFARLSA